jgi:hypothetical protein
MPVPPEIGLAERHHHQMPDPDRNFLLATGTHVELARLERMHEPDLHIVSAATVPVHG